MITTATNILKGVFKSRKGPKQGIGYLPWTLEKVLKHQEDKQVKKVKIGNLVIWYKRPYELLNTYKELYEKGLYKFSSSTTSPIIIDCGSNIGLSVLYYKQLYPFSSIVAFEPDEQNFLLLQKNVASNNLSEVQLHQAAVWIHNGTISFEGRESEASHISDGDTSHQVASLRLKDVLEQHDQIDFLKIDIEGAEWPVLVDCKESLQHVAHLFLEYHGKVDDTNKLTELLDIVKQNGFKVYIRNAADNLEHPFEERTTATIYDVQLNLFCYR